MAVAAMFFGGALGMWSATVGSWGLGVVIAVVLIVGGRISIEKRRQDAAIRS